MEPIMAGLMTKALGLDKLFQTVSLLELGLKIVILMFIIGWVRMHIGAGRLATFVMLLVGYFILFKWWAIFGPLSILYLLIISGATSIVMDIIFTKAYYTPGPSEAEMQQQMAAARFMEGGQQ